MIIHMLDPIRVRNEGKARYLCIQSCYPIFEKSTTSKRKVTCKNCKNILKRMKMKTKIIKCDKCSNDATHINEQDPYSKEINDEIRLINYCDNHWQDSCDDI